MSTASQKTVSFSRFVVGALAAAAISVVATVAAAEGQTPVGVSEPGHVPPARAFLRQAPAAPAEANAPQEGNLRDEPRRAAWEDCEPGSYWMMEGVDYSTPMLCK